MGEVALKKGALLLAILFVAIIIAAASLGAAHVSWRKAFSGDETARAVLVRIRLSRVVVAALIGATLAVAGVTFQTLLRNPLADPFILGVSGGAACGAAVVTALGLARVPGLVPVVAFAGACGATVAVFLVARRRGRTDTTRLLLSGLILNALFSAIILIAFALAPASDMSSALRWMMGSLAGAAWNDAILLGVMFVIGTATLVYIANDLRMLAFGEDDARAHGVNVERVKLIGFGAASIITGAAVAVSGIIGFVGLLVPHLVRLIWRRDYRFLLPLCVLAGPTLLVASDTLARVAIAPVELPVGAITALLGVPFFLSLLRSGR
ncbi:MAG TPA: iron ABC transporter permease [Thermoanaerobaculia bacterium]